MKSNPLDTILSPRITVWEEEKINYWMKEKL